MLPVSNCLHKDALRDPSSFSKLAGARTLSTDRLCWEICGPGAVKGPEVLLGLRGDTH